MRRLRCRQVGWAGTFPPNRAVRGTAPGAHYEEARRAESRADFAHKTLLAAKEAGEAGYWLRVALEAGLLSDEFRSSVAEAHELAAILSASARTARAKPT